MIHFHFLHGFLGLPTDWGPLMLEMKSRFAEKHYQFHMHNLWKDLAELPIPNLRNWGMKFTEKLPPSGNVLIGYSLGGRLAMHFPVWEQRKIMAMVLIAAHPGLEDGEERKKRVENDLAWAKRFEKDPWDHVVRDWNNQPIFNFDRIRPPRKETDFSRSLLVKALDCWSLGQQDNMVDRLKEFQFPIYYFHGEKDEKFAAVARQLKLQMPSILIRNVPGGHSPHFSAPSHIVEQLNSFHNGLQRI